MSTEKVNLAEELNRILELSGILNEADDIDLVNAGYSLEPKYAPKADYMQVKLIKGTVKPFDSGRGYQRYEFEIVDDHGNIWKGDVSSKKELPKLGDTYSVQYMYSISDNQYDETFELKP